MADKLGCPACGSPRLRVLDSRPHEAGVRRRRQCFNGHRFTTIEIPISEFHKQIEEAVDEVIQSGLKAIEQSRDSYRNRNRG